ncbi:hypothetical protein [Pseudosulfitobacter koreensis]|uniref:N-(5'-phosphoribosyl)anthranilate isomerase n=1 Tax=Pseudosulfitobacter koreensis TaxID=2968472 RepID=A0ABT1Z0G3_9RHOB|nr:hypothetical protein [Pseudosulfitobacter koreense]MCR8826638.1 hypothetical protein [Pseudosulfitobacter koreense]
MSEFSPHGPFSPERYMLEIFSAKAARQGAVVRRKIRDIERYVGRDAFLREVQRRGYGVIENAGQFIIFCNQEPIRVLL